MTKTIEQIRKQVQNCRCEKSRATLNALPDESLLAVFNASMDDDDDEDDDEDGKRKNNEGEETHAFDLKPGTQSGKAQQAGSDGKRDDYNADGVKQPPKLPTGNADVQRWLRSAPAPIRDMVTNALQAEHDQKLALVRRLVDNTRLTNNTERRRLGAKWMQLPLADVKELAALLPPVANQDDGISLPLYLGAGDPPAFNTGVDAAADDTLDVPTLNYAEIAAEHRNNGRATVTR